MPYTEPQIFRVVQKRSIRCLRPVSSSATAGGSRVHGAQVPMSQAEPQGVQGWGKKGSGTQEWLAAVSYCRWQEVAGTAGIYATDWGPGCCGLCKDLLAATGWYASAIRVGTHLQAGPDTCGDSVATFSVSLQHRPVLASAVVVVLGLLLSITGFLLLMALEYMPDLPSRYVCTQHAKLPFPSPDTLSCSAPCTHLCWEGCSKVT
jgi:hypothetical protein